MDLFTDTTHNTYIIQPGADEAKTLALFARGTICHLYCIISRIGCLLFKQDRRRYIKLYGKHRCFCQFMVVISLLS